MGSKTIADELMTPAELIDRLGIVNIKLFHVIDKKHEAAQAGDLEESGRQGIVEDTLNGQRSQLKNALNEKLGVGSKEIKVGSQEKLQK